MKCPICGSDSGQLNIDPVNLHFIEHLAREKKMDSALTMTRIMLENFPQISLAADMKGMVDELSKALLQKTQDEIRSNVKREFQEARSIIETEFKTLREVSPTLRDTLNEMQAITDRLKMELTAKFRETLSNLGFPEPEQLKLLSRLIPATLPLLEELVRFQKVPCEKGKLGEIQLFGQIQEYFPEDHCEHLGGPGDTDIVVRPKFNGMNLDQSVIVESKKDSSWNRAFLEEVRKHMQLRGIGFAILALDTMPKGGNDFMVEYTNAGVILITCRDNFVVTYGALRSALITLRLFRRNPIDLRKLFSDQKITEVIKTAYGYTEFTKRIRERAQRIQTNTLGIKDEVESLDQHLKHILSELQKEINDAILQLNAKEQEELWNKPRLEAVNQ